MKSAALRLAFLSAATLAANSAHAQALPPYTAAYEPQTVDERGQWMEADEYERALRDSPLVIRDEALNSYVRKVLCNTVGQDRCKSVRVYVLEVPDFNAFMTPNGTMVVWSGLLLRAQNSAELGAVLGHEFAHFELRHGVKSFKRARSTSDVLAWISVLGAMSNTNTSLTQLVLIGSFYRFSRDQEKEADLLGLKYLSNSQYPSIAASQIWQHAMAESDATAIGRKQKPKQKYAAGYFASHPTDLSRATYLAEAASKNKGGSQFAALDHRSGLGKYLPLFLSSQVKRNDFGGSEYLLSQLASTSGWTADLIYARAELYRARGNPRDLVSAAQFYSDAIKQGYSAPEAQRGLGLSLMRSGQLTQAKAALSEYLRLKPDAADAKAVNALLSN